jgi:hypothetical protein
MMDKGPWTVEYSKAKRMWCLQSDDFEHDVRLYITGDFADEDQRRRYANWLARRLNRTVPDAGVSK